MGIVAPAGLAADPPRPRARDLGIEPGVFPPGPLNAITDVEGVKVGQVTLSQGEDIRTGVTAILPHGGNLFQEKVAGAVFVGNAFGKLAGSTQVEELGTIETPIILTNTLSVGTAIEAVVAHTLKAKGNASVRSVNALVGETNDGGLNDIRAQHVRREHIWQAIDQANGGPVTEGCVGAGTGTACFAWKGGIGTSSRVLPERFGGYKLGILVQTNFGGVLTIAGAPVGKALGRYEYNPDATRGRLRRDRAAEIALRRAERRLLHDRGGHRRPARRSRPQATGCPVDLRPGADRLILQQRQRRLRHRLHHVARAEDPPRRDPTGPAPHAPDRRGLPALPGGARGDRGGRLQRPVPGDHDDRIRPDARGDPHRLGPRDPQAPRPGR